jgi:hypothetical protein
MLRKDIKEPKTTMKDTLCLSPDSADPGSVQRLDSVLGVARILHLDEGEPGRFPRHPHITDGAVLAEHVLTRKGDSKIRLLRKWDGRIFAQFYFSSTEFTEIN